MPMKLPHSPLILPVGLFSLGAIISFYFSFYSIKWSFFGFGILFLIVLFQFIKSSFLKPFKTILIYGGFLMIGYLYFLNYYLVSPNHYEHKINEALVEKLILIEDQLGSNSFSNSYSGKIISWGKTNVDGKILIRQSKDKRTIPFQKSQKILTREAIEPIKGPHNPGQFSYKDYLANLKIRYQIDLDTTNSIALGIEKELHGFSFTSLAERAYSKIKKSPLSKTSQGMIKALLFADRNALENELIENYTKAGIIHLLALSGLHVGLFVGILLFVLKPLNQFHFGTTLRTLLILCFLWLFAFFVGFPPSVTRSVTMFSFIVIGRSIHFGKNTFHYTLLSFFILIICYPPFLRTLGFQLSYLAVFGILLLHPLFQQLCSPRSLILKKYWEWTTVCVAAQLAVSPISIYYFHQFPSLFLISNLLIIPFFGVFLMLCICVFVILAFFSLHPTLALFFDSLVNLLNHLVAWIAEQESFLFDELFLSLKTTILIYCSLFAIVIWAYKHSVLKAFSSVIITTCLCFNLVKEYQNARAEHSFWILHKYMASAIVNQQGTHLQYFSSNTESTTNIFTDFSNSRIHKSTVELFLNKAYLQKHLNILILDKGDSLYAAKFEPDYILLRNNPKINVERLLKYYSPKILIADGTNAPWNTLQWRKTCKEKKINFHETRVEGALKINL